MSILADLTRILAKIARQDIIKMTTVSSSGHPGGSMSSIDFYLSSILDSNVFKINNIPDDKRNKIFEKLNRFLLEEKNLEEKNIVFSFLKELTEIVQDIDIDLKLKHPEKYFYDYESKYKEKEKMFENILANEFDNNLSKIFVKRNNYYKNYFILLNIIFEIDYNNFFEDVDTFFISHGHTSPGWYSALGVLGIADRRLINSGFRDINTPFSGHVEHQIPLIEWDTGNLGQGLSAATGKALFNKKTGYNSHVITFMGDGEQQKGQISEARRFIKKFDLTNLTVIIDYNELQISGNIHSVMPQNIDKEWEAAGFKVVHIDGHNAEDLYEILNIVKKDKENVYCIMAHTHMGKGVSFMEDKEKYHGSTLKIDKYVDAIKELGGFDDINFFLTIRKTMKFEILSYKDYFNDYKIKNFKEDIEKALAEINEKPNSFYSIEDKVDCRSAFGKVLVEIANENKKLKTFVFDCDLSGSVKTKEFASLYSDYFIQSGIQEHHTAVSSGRLSKEKALVFYSDFAIFGMDETFNQQRLNSINETNLKVVLTHAGANVGEDGKTHQAINYIAIPNTIFDFKLILPADPNQTLYAVKYAAKNYGNYFVVMGRSKTPIISTDEKTPFFGKDYKFEYGKADIIIKSNKNYLVSAGPVFGEVYKAALNLRKEGIDIGLINISTPLEIDKDLIIEFNNKNLFVIEDHNINSGLYSLILAFIAKNKINANISGYGINNYPPSGNYIDVYKKFKIDVESITKNIKKNIEI